MKRAVLIAAVALAIVAITGPRASMAMPVATSSVVVDTADLATALQPLARQQKFKGGGGGNKNANRGGGGNRNANRGNNNRNNNKNFNNNRNNNKNFNNNRNRNVNVRVNVRPVRGWVRRPYYGTIIGGVALGTIIAASVVPVAPASNLCWYWADSSQTRGYWDYCM